MTPWRCQQRQDGPSTVVDSVDGTLVVDFRGMPSNVTEALHESHANTENHLRSDPDWVDLRDEVCRVLPLDTGCYGLRHDASSCCICCSGPYRTIEKRVRRNASTTDGEQCEACPRPRRGNGEERALRLLCSAHAYRQEART